MRHTSVPNPQNLMFESWGKESPKLFIVIRTTNSLPWGVYPKVCGVHQGQVLEGPLNGAGKYLRERKK